MLYMKCKFHSTNCKQNNFVYFSFFLQLLEMGERALYRLAARTILNLTVIANPMFRVKDRTTTSRRARYFRLETRSA